MDLTGLRELVPLGGSVVLLVYLLRVIFGDRKQAGIDRAREREEHRKEREALIENHRKEKEDLEAYWRKRCEHAEWVAFGRRTEPDESI